MLYDPWRCEADTEKGLQKAGNEGLFTDFYPKMFAIEV